MRTDHASLSITNLIASLRYIISHYIGITVRIPCKPCVHYVIIIKIYYLLILLGTNYNHDRAPLSFNAFMLEGMKLINNDNLAQIWLVL